MELVSTVVDYLNANQPLVVALAALVAVMVQYGVNHIKELSKLSNYTLALVALPGVTTALAAFGTSLHLSAYPWTVLVGQIIYAVYEKLKASAVAQVTVAPDVLGPGV